MRALYQWHVTLFPRSSATGRKSAVKVGRGKRKLPSDPPLVRAVGKLFQWDSFLGRKVLPLDSRRLKESANIECITSNCAALIPLVSGSIAVQTEFKKFDRHTPSG
ncbi:hypothetical protein CDAR_75791 [Caerostris darwini]|uniref:Uncharacterized protein n=1 Tax=Caerostris darwini TaxID=1538125 RepID=A0AAV4W1L0_9ARAC|nr:hypothetical protein CDAR_75791 [Caerostris darwini]